MENIDSSRFFFFFWGLNENFKIINYSTNMCQSCQATQVPFKFGPKGRFEEPHIQEPTHWGESTAGRGEDGTPTSHLSWEVL
jgi:hypothetical protein